MQAYDEAEIKRQLSSLPLWTIRSGRLVREFTFANFVAAMSFVNRIATLAESAGHHPDIDIRYNRVMLGLETHDANGITEKDFRLAKQAEEALAG